MNWRADSQTLIGRGISLLATLPFIPSAFLKLVPNAQVTEGMARLGIPASLLPTLAMLELSCAVLYLIPATSILGSILFTGYIGGIIFTHLRVGDPVYIPIVLGLLVWLGPYLREPRLRPLVPLRR